MGWARIKGNLTSRIGCQVSFGAPKDVLEKGHGGISGEIIDEVWAYPDENTKPPHEKPCRIGDGCWGDYSFCSQLIRWPTGEHAIRLAYYRRRCGEDHWEYASQMTVSSECETIRTLLERTLAQTAWFQPMPSASPR